MIVDLAARRRMIAVGQEMVDVAFDAPVGHAPERILEDAESALMDVRAKELAHAATTRVEASAAAAELLAKVDRIRAGEKVGQGVTTGIPSIDNDTGGLRPGDLWVVAGRASMGKTIMATSLARAAARSGAGTLLFPFEIGREQAVARILSDLAYASRAPLGYGRIMKGDLDEEDRWRLEEAAPAPRRDAARLRHVRWRHAGSDRGSGPSGTRPHGPARREARDRGSRLPEFHPRLGPLPGPAPQ